MSIPTKLALFLGAWFLLGTVAALLMGAVARMGAEEGGTVSDLLLQIGRQAVIVESARQAADSLRKRRAELYCECYASDTDKPPQQEGEPCWKRVRWLNEDTTTQQLPQDEWCEACRRRQRAHEAYLTAAQRLGSFRGALTRLCRLALAEEQAS